jgi:hypothetical protein
MFLQLFRKKNESIQLKTGFINYFSLQKVWFDLLNDSDRNEVRKFFGEKSMLLEERPILNTGMPRADFLTIIGGSLSDKIKKIQIMNIAMGEAEKELNNETLHFIYMNIWKDYKKYSGTDEDVRAEYIKVLIKDCNIHDKILFDLSEYKNKPIYPSFKELAIIYEKTGEYNKAIDISQIALEKRVNETTCFNRRIEKLEKKKLKHVSSDNQ